MDKQIILKPNQPPQFVGSWTIGEIRQMAQGLLMWLDALPISQPQKAEDEKAET